MGKAAKQAKNKLKKKRLFEGVKSLDDEKEYLIDGNKMTGKEIKDKYLDRLRY